MAVRRRDLTFNQAFNGLGVISNTQDCLSVFLLCQEEEAIPNYELTVECGVEA